MQTGFSLKIERAVVGQKYDTTPATIVSLTCKDESVPFGALVVVNPEDRLACKLPKSAADLNKPVGITLRQLHSKDYSALNPLAILKQGRIWVEAEDVTHPGDAVFIKFDEEKKYCFTGKKDKATQLKGAIFLEPTIGPGKVPIELDLVGGGQ